MNLLSYSEAVSQTMAQAPFGRREEIALRSVFQPRGAERSTGDEFQTLLDRAGNALRILQEIRTSVTTLEGQLTDPEFEDAWQKLKAKWRCEFMSQKTWLTVFRLNLAIQRGNGNHRLLKKEIHDIERQGFSAWFHHLTGNKEVGCELLRRGPTLEHVVDFSEFRHQLRVRKEPEELPPPPQKRNRHR